MKMPKEFRIPVKRLKRPKKGNPLIGTELEAKVRYYEVDGRLHLTYNKNNYFARPIYFIQSSDGEMSLINKPAYPGATVLETLLPFFQGNKKRDLIRFDWPEYKPDLFTNNEVGIALLLGIHHPNQTVRMLALNRCYHLAHFVPLIPCQDAHEPTALTV